MPKTGKATMDMIVYMNQILGLTENGVDEDGVVVCAPDSLEQYVRQEVMGAMEVVKKCFVDYAGYLYNRSANFNALPNPAYIPAQTEEQLEDPPQYYPAEGDVTEGYFEYDKDLGGGLTAFTTGAILDVVPFEGGPGVGDVYDLVGFTQAADDTREVINFMHTWPVQEIYVTPIPCEISAQIFYDLSISEVSGLQVPKNYVNNTEREFTVSVANAGPNAADFTVTVAAACDGCPLEPWTYDWEDLAAGQSKSFTTLFTIDTTSSAIDWTAHVEPTGDGTDPNMDNNDMEATSSVRASKGRGGGH